MINGSFYDGVTSKPFPCELEVNIQGDVKIAVGEQAAVEFHSLRISPRIGNTVRTIRFANGTRFETQHNDSVDSLIQAHGKNESPWLSMHQWESKTRMVVLATLITVVCLFGFIFYGIPEASKSIANKLPAYVSSSLAQDALKELDTYSLDKSDLIANRQQQLTELFSVYLPNNSDFNYRVIFRKSKRFGANALALPDGTILFTDDLVNLSVNDDELVAVLLHEIGHIEYRHSLRNVVEATGLYAMYSWMTGDVEVSSVAVLAASGLLLKARYSRGHESEADDYSLSEMLANDINPHHFATMMRKLDDSHKSKWVKKSEKNEVKKGEQETEVKESEADEIPDNSGLSRVLDYLSSHPASEDRIKLFKDAAKRNGFSLLEPK